MEADELMCSYGHPNDPNDGIAMKEKRKSLESYLREDDIKLLFSIWTFNGSHFGDYGGDGKMHWNEPSKCTEENANQLHGHFEAR